VISVIQVNIRLDVCVLVWFKDKQIRALSNCVRFVHRYFCS